MINFVLVVMLTNNKFGEYQNKKSKNVSSRGAKNRKYVTYENNNWPVAYLSYIWLSYRWQVETISSIFIFAGIKT